MTLCCALSRLRGRGAADLLTSERPRPFAQRKDGSLTLTSSDPTASAGRFPRNPRLRCPDPFNRARLAIAPKDGIAAAMVHWLVHRHPLQPWTVQASNRTSRAIWTARPAPAGRPSGDQDPQSAPFLCENPAWDRVPFARGVGAERDKLTAPRRFDYGQMSTKPMPA